MKIYIAGKITGLVYEDALRAFAEAAAEIERCGHAAVNPMRLIAECGMQNAEWIDLMVVLIPYLLECDGIYLLPNWKESPGARIEKVIAECSKMLIVTAGFKGRRGEVFPVCIHCGIVLTEDDAPDDGLATCLNCCKKLTEMASHERKHNYCGRCGRKLNEVESDLGDGECFRCHNSISHLSGVGIQSAARV